MSDLDFDLNAPAAPSLTLDAAPAAPTLTLDPEADAKVVEEAKKATPVTVEDTPLSPEEQKMVQDFAEKIDLTNSQMILQYGAASQKKLSDFSDSALSRVRTKDMGETGELITQLIGELKGFDATAENQKGFLGFFKKKSNELERGTHQGPTGGPPGNPDERHCHAGQDVPAEPCLFQGAEHVYPGRPQKAAAGAGERPGRR